MAYIEIKNVTFSYPKAEGNALQDVNINIEKGEYVTICGKSGSGKTTLLKLLKPALAPAGEIKGTVSIGGIDPKDMDLKKQATTVGYVMQNPEEQIVTDKVWHELAFGLESIGTDPVVMRTRVAEMANYFGIQGWFEKDVALLSGGQKQLLNLASIMAMQPEIIILDEPASQLDPIAASDFLNTIRKINLELGTTIIITEHRLEDIYPVSDKVLVLEDGKQVGFGTPREVAAILGKGKNDMFAALPAPARVYYGINEQAQEEACPLNVREGRRWLEEKAAERDKTKTSPAETIAADVNAEPAKTTVSITEESTAEPIAPVPEKKPDAIKIKNLWFRYERDGADILQDCQLTVARGTTYSIVGGNGTGKSTLLKNICGALKPYRGKIEINGMPLSKITKKDLFKGTMAMLPQNPRSLFIKTTVREDLEEMLGASEAGRYERLVETKGSENVPLDERIAKVAELCDITKLMKRHPYDLSGGELQRAALAKILLTDPDILLLDEPTKGIDCFFKAKLGEIFARLKESGKTILFVSHDVEFSAKYADRVGMFFGGNIISEGTPTEVFSGNSFYTTSASRMARGIFPEVITAEEIIRRLEK